MSEKKKLIVLKIVGVVLNALMSILKAIEADGVKSVDKSVLEEEIPLENCK